MKEQEFKCWGRPCPTKPAQSGKPERLEQDDIHYGPRALVASFVVATGEFIGDLGPTRTCVNLASTWGMSRAGSPEMLEAGRLQVDG